MRGVVGERRLHVELLWRVGRAGKPRHAAASGVEVYQVEGELLCRGPRLRGGARPVGGVQPREPRVLAVRAYVAADAVYLLERHVELVAAGVFQQEVVALLAADFLAHDFGEQRHAVRGVHHVVAGFEGKGHLRDVHMPTRATLGAAGIHARVQVCKREDGEMRLGYHGAGRQRRVHKGDAPARDGGHRGRRAVQAARVQGVGIALEQRHLHALPHRARVLGRYLQAFLKGNAFIGKRELERLARPAIGDGEHAGIMAVHDLLDASDKATIRTGDGRLLGLELSRNRTARADDAHQVETLVAAEVQRVRPHVQPLETRDLSGSRALLQLLVGAGAVVEERTGLREHHERGLGQVRERGVRVRVEQR